MGNLICTCLAINCQHIELQANGLMEKPRKPGPGECCGGGSCCPCVIDDYVAKLKVWRRARGIEQAENETKEAEGESDAARRERRLFR